MGLGRDTKIFKNVSGLKDFIMWCETQELFLYIAHLILVSESRRRDFRFEHWLRMAFRVATFQHFWSEDFFIFLNIT